MKTTGIIVFISLAVVFITESSAKSYPHIKATCESDTECSYPEICYNGECQHACRLRNAGVWKKPCGPNAACMTEKPHTAVCRCQPFHIGNPDIECVKVESSVYFDDLQRRNREKENTKNHL